MSRTHTSRSSHSSATANAVASSPSGSSQPAQPQKSSHLPAVASRTSIPALPSKSFGFPSLSADAYPDTITSTPSPPSFQRRTAISGPSPVSTYARAMSNSTSPPAHPGSTSRSSSLAIAGQATAGLTSPSILSSSLSRNSSVPASLTYTTRPPNTPPRPVSASQSRPSLSSPSPPTPVVPSIPLRHATQRSPAQTSSTPAISTAPSTPNTPLSAPASHSREVTDRHTTSKRRHTEINRNINTLATSSDSNLPSSSHSPSSTTPESNHWVLTLKQLLAKPAIPANPHNGNESDGGKTTAFSSAPDSIQYATGRGSESEPIVLGRPRSRQYPAALARDKIDPDVFQAYQQTKQEQRERARQEPEQSLFGPGGESKKERRVTRDREKMKEEDKQKETRPRNVLKRRPSANSKVPGPRSPTSPTATSLSRSNSVTSLFKRGSHHFSTRSTSAHAVSPLPNPSAGSLLQANEINDQAVTTTLTALYPAHSHQLHYGKGTQSTSTISSYSSASQHRNDIVYLAGSAADTSTHDPLVMKSPPRFRSSHSQPSSGSPAMADDVGGLAGPSPAPPANLTHVSEIPAAGSKTSLTEADSKAGRSDLVGLAPGTTNEGGIEEDARVPSQAAQKSATHGTPKVSSPSSPGSDPSSSQLHLSIRPPPPIISPPPRTSSTEANSRSRFKKVRHYSDQSEHAPYYTVFGAPHDRVLGVGGPRDSYGASFPPPLWGVQTTITAGKPGNFEQDKPSLGQALSRKLSGKFRRDRLERMSEGDLKMRGRRTAQQDDCLPGMRPLLSPSKATSPEKKGGNHGLPYPYSSEKHTESETDVETKTKSGKRFKFWRLVGKSRSKERDGEAKVTSAPPLPALPKDYRLRNASQPGDIYSSTRRGQDGSALTSSKKSSRSPQLTSPPSAHPSATTHSSSTTSPGFTPKFWSRTQSARSSSSSLDDIPLIPTARHVQGRAPAAVPIRHSPQKDELTSDTQRSGSPPIPLFSNTDVINAFPPRRSSDRSKNSPTTSSPGATATPSSAASPPPRPQRSSHRPKAHLHTNSFGDETLYPPVMKQVRTMPKMTFREIDSEKRTALTEQEKVDKWAALLENSAAAGGTLHFGGSVDKLPSDELRFSRTLSELARDDE